MTRNRKRKGKRVIKVYKTIKIRKEVFMDTQKQEQKRKINWYQVALDVLKVVLGALVGTQL